MKIDFLLIAQKIVLKILLIKKCAYNSSTLFYPVPFNPFVMQYYPIPNRTFHKKPIIPKYAGCVNGVQWFRDRGQWADGSYEPSPGTIIFFDWEGDGVTDHTGIVQKCENGTVYTVEGNSGDTCRTKTYTVGSSVIYGYGIPAY